MRNLCVGEIGGCGMNMFVDYIPAKECKNEDVVYTCYKCGECGRKFNECGIMVDNGGTYSIDEEDLM